jgi:hypothetical protein
MNERASLDRPETPHGNGEVRTRKTVKKALGVGNKAINKSMQASAKDKETKEPNADLAEGKRNERPRARSNGTNERTGKKKQAEKGTVTAGTRTKNFVRAVTRK